MFIIMIASSCTSKPYTLEDGYIFIQNEGRHLDKENWQLVWTDDFEASQIDASHWTRIDRWTDDDFGMPIEEWYGDIEKWKDHRNLDCFSYVTSSDDLYEVKNGELLLWGKINKDTLADPRPYLQGAVKSKGKFAFQYGKIEIRAKLQGAGGSWPAFWMLSEKNIYEDLPNRNGEIDIMERLNHEDFVYQTTHSYWTIGMKNKMNPQGYATTKINAEDYNVYGLEWYPDRLVYTVNGKVSYEYPKLEGVDAAQWPFDQPFYIMLDQQLGGNWVGAVDPEDLPAVVSVDWVKVYQ